MPAKAEAGLLQVNNRGLRKYNAAQTLLGLAGTHHYSRVEACAIKQPSDRTGFKKFKYPQYLISVNIK